LTLLADHIPSVNGSYPLQIGTARSRGMGEAIMYLPDGPEPQHDLNALLDSFQPRDRAGGLLYPETLYIALTLRSPLLIYGKTGMPTVNLERDVIAPYVESIPPSLEFCPECSMIEQDTWSGWSAAWGLPKPAVPAVSQGSVLLFRAASEEKDLVLKFMQELTAQGLGERTGEGWGEISPCDPFHVYFDAGGIVQ